MIEIEKAILGSVLHDTSATWVLEKLKPEYFYSTKMRLLYEFMQKTCAEGKPLDLILHFETLQQNDLALAWKDCLESPATIALVPVYLSKLREAHAERTIARILTRSGAQLVDEDRKAIKELLDESDGSASSNSVHAGERMQDVLEEINERAGKPPELPFGIPMLDDTLWGAHRGELLVIGAYTGVGKTTVLTNFAWNMARTGKRILYFSTEMTVNEFVKLRLLPLASTVDSWLLRRNRIFAHDKSNWVKISKGAELISRTPFMLNDLSSPSLADIRYAIRQEKPNAVFVDYINRCKMPKGENRALQVYAFVQGLKGIARDENLPVIAAAQLNRDSREDKAPSTHHLRESGGIEIESDSIILLHHADPKSSQLELIIGKNRHGETSSITVYRDNTTLAIKPHAPGSEAAA